MRNKHFTQEGAQRKGRIKAIFFFFFFFLALGVHDLVSPILDVMLTSISDGNMIGLKLQIYFRKW